MPIAPGAIDYKFSYQLCPIFLTGGIAQNVPGQALPIIQITQALSSPGGDVLSAALDLDDFFCNFVPLPGATIIDNVTAEYPSANQTVAANALIENPLNISLKMIAPAGPGGGYLTKTQTMLMLQATLQQHNRSAGTYTIVTPAAYYQNCIMIRMTDITGNAGHQVQVEWQLDFRQPLLTLQQAQQAQNSLMGKLSNGGQLNTADMQWSGTGTNIGQQSPLTPSPQGAQSIGSSMIPGEPLPYTAPTTNTQPTFAAGQPF